MPGILRVVASRVVPVVRAGTRNITAHPPQDKVGVVESIIGMASLTGAILGPSSWILCHLEDYKKRD